MRAAAGVVVGEHDFTSFAAVDPEREDRMLVGETLSREGHEGTQREGTSNVRTIYSSGWTREADELVYTVRGNGFLHHMVRNLVGTFILVGKGTLACEDFARILAARNRSAAGATAPAAGLYLVGVQY
jgi:tRNA pseudouridine38-40 synthase